MQSDVGEEKRKKKEDKSSASKNKWSKSISLFYCMDFPFLQILNIIIVFGQTLLALKIYSTRYVHYRFSALIASARTQPMVAFSRESSLVSALRWLDYIFRFREI